MNMLGAVIFDFDGVITDSEYLHYRAFDELTKSYGFSMPKHDYWSEFLGYTDKECLEAIAAKYDRPDFVENCDRLIEEKFVIFEKLVQEEAVIIDGVCDFLTMLKNNNVPMAICSGALLSDIESVFDSCKNQVEIDLPSFFEVIVTADDVVKGKPDPEGYLKTLEKLKNKLGAEFAGSDCIVVEDSHWGLEAAIAAGMKTVAVTNSYSEEELNGKSDLLVDNLREVTIDQLRGITA